MDLIKSTVNKRIVIFIEGIYYGFVRLHMALYLLGFVTILKLEMLKFRKKDVATSLL